MTEGYFDFDYTMEEVQNVIWNPSNPFQSAVRRFVSILIRAGRFRIDLVQYIGRTELTIELSLDCMHLCNGIAPGVNGTGRAGNGGFLLDTAEGCVVGCRSANATAKRKR